jgi:hypothetical protein
MIGYVFRAITGTSPLQKTLRRHFGRVPLGQIATAARDFPVTSRVDLQAALEDMFRSRVDAKLLGIFSPNFHESPTLAQVFAGGPFMMNIGPLQHDEIDTGERLPVRCLRNGLWLARHNGVPFAVLLAPSMRFGQVGGVHVEVAVPTGESGLALSQELFADLERRVGSGRTYRGRIISLEHIQDPTGRGGAIKVHRLPAVKRDDVILPERMLEVLDRNLNVPAPLVDVIVHRTQGVSAAFIKELMRRAAQFQIESGTDTALQERPIDRALEDIVFAGGSLNLKLLGGATTSLDANRGSTTRITVQA